MELHQVEEAAVESINIKLTEVVTSETQPFIYKVHHQYLHGSNDKVYEPQVVSIGPYHHGKPGLKIVEQLKPGYLKSILHRKNDTVDRYISAAAEIDQAARSCYAEPISLSPAEFVEMLVLDSCFIIGYLLNLGIGQNPIFQMRWIFASLEFDLMLFENQIPFSVLCKMFDLIDMPNQHQKLIEEVCTAFRKEDLYFSNWNNRSPEEVKHLLHLMHTVSRPSSPYFINLSRSSQPTGVPLIPSATELKDANVRFLKKESNNLYEVEFKNGTLKMPALLIEDKTERSLRNFIIHEQYFPDNLPTYVTDYTSKDVEILSDCGIIKNITADNQGAADIINRLGRSVMYSSKFIYSDMFTSINAHYKKPWNRSWAALNRDYFNTPWAYFSFFAAVVLLLLTVAQTILSTVQL